jgi:FKBP-type peptidyl-prolyl cis-trans isomerase
MMRTVLGAAAALAIVACASGGGSAATAATTAATSSAAAPIPAVPDGDIEHTTFGPSLNVELSKMTRRPTGLYVQDFEIGTGSVAARGRTAVVRYTGYLADGKQFDSGEITIGLGSGKVIRAWEDGVLGMRVGGKRRLVSPPHLAYGAKGSPPVIPPNAVLVFDMELTQVY